jgi:hypothetical protein
VKRTCQMVNGELVWTPPFDAADQKRHAERFDAMVESRQVPGCMTDAVFLEGNCCGSQFEVQPGVGDYYREVAKEAGVNVTGKKYMSGLASFPGDPRAWVDGRGDVQRIVEERGWACDGAVKVEMPQVAPLPATPVAENLIREAMLREVTANPGLLEKPVEEVREKVTQKITPHWAK